MVVVSCTAIASHEERITSIVASAPNCIAPCWNNIQPGKSSTADFLSLVDASSKDSFKDLEFRSSPVWNGYLWTDRRADLFTSMETRNNQVGLLRFQPRSEFPLEALITTMGVPEDYLAVYSWGEREFVTIYLFYTNDGIVVKARVPWQDIDTVGCSFEIDETMLVHEIYLTQPQPLTQLITELPRFSAHAQFNPFPWQEDDFLDVHRCPS